MNIVEIDSLPNLVTNVSPRPTAVPNCDTMKANGNYVKGVGYALAKLGSIPNAYNYVDAGHHGWIGWDDNFNASAKQIAEAAKAEGSTLANVHGFIANTANYGATTEPFFKIGDTANDGPIREKSKWIDWNRYVDEQSFAQAFRAEVQKEGFSPDVGMLIDTSRNGWGGAARPTAAGPKTTSTRTSTEAAPTAGSTWATGATRRAPVSAHGPRRPRHPVSTRMSGSSPRVSRTAPAR